VTEYILSFAPAPGLKEESNVPSLFNLVIREYAVLLLPYFQKAHTTTYFP
jgi:hypothetical protein